ncbi:pro-neuregulin-1, membrane-bound isoform isoform X2 [Pungitius pungitius]|uniref:pro-neuregulin-1, membrane-bound isoform isoform X2 n=1 Tax=Pungitius pungitius TaxID=134920 RepID=UPI00188748C4|nr:pro-neuregulin-1, membrane-bound isoform isoform X2 [Pungitius pungitius]
MTEGMEDFSAGPANLAGSVTPTRSTVDTGQVPEEKPKETAAAGQESGEESLEGGGGGDGEHLGALGIVAVPGSCCVCMEMEQINNCLHSEKICILPILACLLSLALCTAGLKWVFVDKIFQYEPPTHLDPKRIGQDPIIISVTPTLGLTMSIPHSSPSFVSLTTAVTQKRSDDLMEKKSTQGPYMPHLPRVTLPDPSVTLKYNAERPTVQKQTPHPQTSQESNDIIIPTISATSSTTTTKTSSHVTRCSHSQRNYCVNGGECFTLEITPGSTKFLCRCPNEFTGDRCQNYVMASFYKHLGIEYMAEELYQKRILTITGICIALLVVGIMCVVAYCKTKKQRRKLHDHLRQSLRKKRTKNSNTGIGSNLADSARGCQDSNLPLQDLQLIDHCNKKTSQHGGEEKTETNLSTRKKASFVHGATAFSDISSKRCAPAMTTKTQPCLVSQTSPAGSPPSEMSAPLSSLAISVPSLALSPSGEEERPLLLSNTFQPCNSLSRDEQKRTSAHYNHGHVAHSLPPSPLFTMENGHYIGEYDNTAGSHVFSALPETLQNTNNNINPEKIPNGHRQHNVGDNMLVREKEKCPGEHNTTLLLKVIDSSRTNPASPTNDTQDKSSSSTAKHNPIAL